MAKKSGTSEQVYIPSANIQRIKVPIVGTAPLVMHRFGEKAKKQMMDKMASSEQEKKKRAKRDARDYDKEMVDAQHRDKSGWAGIPCGAFRAAIIRACSLTPIPMTVAKMAIFVRADGFDEHDGTPLVKIKSKKGPRRCDLGVRNENGAADIRSRPMWDEWGAELQIDFDADLVSRESVVHLLDRAGKQVGILEGRPFSKKSHGMDWGTFEVKQ